MNNERFELLEQIGKGGMGVVWKARRESDGSIVALKLLHSIYLDEPDYIARFEREVDISMSIESPYIVKTIGYGTRDGVPYMAMEYVEGQSLRQLLKEHGKLSWEEARPILMQVAKALEAAHAANVIHRDVKPSNILITRDGTAKLADFGIARALELTALTGSSTMLGTPAYMAPDEKTTAASDLYSLGIVAYEMLTGIVPLSGNSQAEMIVARLTREVDLSLVPPEARSFVASLLVRDPAGRTTGPSEAWRLRPPAEFEEVTRRTLRRRNSGLMLALGVTVILVTAGLTLAALSPFDDDSNAAANPEATTSLASPEPQGQLTSEPTSRTSTAMPDRSVVAVAVSPTPAFPTLYWNQNSSLRDVRVRLALAAAASPQRLQWTPDDDRQLHRPLEQKEGPLLLNAAGFGPGKNELNLVLYFRSEDGVNVRKLRDSWEEVLGLTITLVQRTERESGIIIEEAFPDTPVLTRTPILPTPVPLAPTPIPPTAPPTRTPTPTIVPINRGLAPEITFISGEFREGNHTFSRTVVNWRDEDGDASLIEMVETDYLTEGFGRASQSLSHVAQIDNRGGSNSIFWVTCTSGGGFSIPLSFKIVDIQGNTTSRSVTFTCY